MKTYSELTENQISHNFNNIDKTEREKAIIEFLNLPVDEWENVKESTHNEQIVEFENEEYLVVTDSEADDLWDESLDNYLEECIYPELEGNLKNYFDDEKWKNDARYDGRAHNLNMYDGSEYQIGDFYIYRQN